MEATALDSHLKPYTVQQMFHPAGRAMDRQGRRYDLVKVYA